MKLSKARCIRFVQTIAIVLIVSMLLVTTANASDDFTLVPGDPIAGAGGKLTDGSYMYCTVIDYNNDGYQDFLSWNGVSGTGEAYWFYKNDGSGGFTEVVPNVVFPMRNGYDYIVVDIDNDSDEDILVPNGTELCFYRNDGKGNFALDTDPITSAGGKLSDGSYMYCIAIDYNNDGYQDFLSSNGESGENEAYWFYKNDGSGGFTEVVPNVVFPMKNGYDYVVVDFDNDSDEDILVPDGSGMSFYKNDGTGNFALHNDPIASAGGKSSDGSHVFCAAIDFDIDGDQDFLSWNGESGENEAYWFYKNDGSGNFTETIPNVVFPMRNGYSYVVVDIDNDSDEDILIPNGSELCFYRQDGTAPSANTAPSITTNNGLTLSEGSTGSLKTHLVATDNEQDDSTLVYTVTDLPTNGVLTKDYVVLPLNSTFTQAQLDAGKISYVHDCTDTTSDGFTFKVSDGAGEEVTGQTFSITITPVNDNPTMSNLPTDVSVVEDTLSNVDLSGASLWDDSGSALITLSIRANSGGVAASSGGGVTVSGSGTQTITLSGTVGDIDTYLNTASNIKFVGPPNAYGNGAATLTLTANDGGNTGTGGGMNVILGSININITAVNDIPYVINNEGLTLNEGATKTISVTTLSAGDVETANSLLTFSVTSGPSNGQLENTDNPDVSITSFTHQNLTDGKIRYVHNDSNTVSDSFTFKVADDEGGEKTGQTFSITVNAIDDDAPTISKNNGLTLNEGATKSLKALLTATDTEQVDATLTYTVTSSPNNGSLSTNTFTQAQLDAGSVTYTHDGSNTTTDSFTFKVADSIPNELTEQTFSITVNAVDDDAPTISKNNGMTVDEGATKSLKALLTATDTEQVDATLTYTVISSPSNGSLSMNTFTQAQLDTDSVTYVHDGSNTTTDTFTFKVADSIPNELTEQTFSITVNAVDDDAPIISNNNGLTLNEGATKSLRTLLTATDTEQVDATLTYTVISSPSNGSLSMNTFTQAQLDTDSVTYAHDGSDTTTDSFTFKVADSIPNELTEQTFSITVNAVDDDAPTISKNDGMTVDEGAAASLKALLAATDTEQNDDMLVYTVTELPQNGSLTMATFTQAQLNAGNVKYTHDGTNTTSDSFMFKVSDGVNELIGQTFSITVNSIDDDKPYILKNDEMTIDEGAVASLKALLAANDTEQNDDMLVYTVTELPQNGSLTMATFTQAQLNAGNVKYTHDGTNTNLDSFMFKVSDGVNELTGQTFSITINHIDTPSTPTPEPTPEPTPTPTINPTEQRVTVTGTLIGDDGKPLVGYTVELHSTPRTTVTDSKGRYTFADVEVADHSLTVKDESNTTLKSFAIAIKTGDNFTWSKPDDNSITAVVQNDTASIDVTININSDGNVTVDKIDNIINPQTGDIQQSSVWTLVSVCALAIAVVLVIFLILILRKQAA